MNTIVVGVDGSESAIGALRFALDEARVRNAHVEVIIAWHPELAFGTEWTLSADAEALNEIAVADLNNSLDEARVAESGIEATPMIVEGEPAEVLCEAARGADLLVVGSHGLGLGAVLGRLGSVSQHCVQRASCPVVVVPADTTLAVPGVGSEALRARATVMSS